MTKAPRTLISYSWDDEDHKKWVLDFATRLRSNGVDAILDRWHVQPGQSLTAFMELEIQKADYVLVICTPNYCEKANRRIGGVGYEQQIISANILEGCSREKFIPIISRKEIGQDIVVPTHFRGVLYLDMSDETNFDHSNDILLRTLFQNYEQLIPPLGVTDILSRTDEDYSDIRLPVMDLDGWHLKSGLAQHQRYPNTFHIPPRFQRNNVKIGDFVKLSFEIKLEKDPDVETFGERMWVHLLENKGPYFIGELNSNPITSSEQNFLQFGDKVVFLPEHIIDID